MNKTSFEDVIARDGQLMYTNVGDSMYPLIQPNDLLVICAVTKPLKQYDVPLYKRDSGQYVLHRIMRISGGEYVMCGDNRASLEHGITDRHIIGVLTEIIRNSESIDVSSLKPSLYIRSMLYRRMIMKLRRILRHDK